MSSSDSAPSWFNENAAHRWANDIEPKPLNTGNFMKSLILKHITLSRMASVMLALLTLLATDYPARAQTADSESRLAAKCRAQLRKCNSHCNLVYESKRAIRVCRNHCEDSY